MYTMLVWAEIGIILATILYAFIGYRAYLYAERRAEEGRKAVGSQKFLVILLMSVGAAAFLASCFSIYHNDLNVYNSWGHYIVKNGVDGFYSVNEIAMPPVFLYLCAGLSGFSDRTGIPFQIGYRVVFSAVFLLSVAVFYGYAKKYLEENFANAATFIYAVSPALFSNCSMWGQTDAFTCLFTVLLFFSVFEKKYGRAFFWLLCGLAFKTQVLFVVPVLGIWMVADMVGRRQIVRLLLYCLSFLAMVWLMYLPFGYTQVKNGEVFFIKDIFFGLANNKSWFSSYALNFWAAFGLNYCIASAAWRYISYGLVLISTILICIAVFRSKYRHKLLLAAILQVSAVFFFCIAMLERYLIATIPLLLLLCGLEKGKNLRVCGMLVCSMHFLAMMLASMATGMKGAADYVNGILFFFAIVNCLLWIWFAGIGIRLLFPSYCPKWVSKIIRKRRSEEQSAEVI